VAGHNHRDRIGAHDAAHRPRGLRAFAAQRKCAVGDHLAGFDLAQFAQHLAGKFRTAAQIDRDIGQGIGAALELGLEAADCFPDDRGHRSGDRKVGTMALQAGERGLVRGVPNFKTVDSAGRPGYPHRADPAVKQVQSLSGLLEH